MHLRVYVLWEGQQWVVAHQARMVYMVVAHQAGVGLYGGWWHMKHVGFLNPMAQDIRTLPQKDSYAQGGVHLEAGGGCTLSKVQACCLK